MQKTVSVEIVRLCLGPMVARLIEGRVSALRLRVPLRVVTQCVSAARWSGMPPEHGCALEQQGCGSTNCRCCSAFAEGIQGEQRAAIPAVHKQALSARPMIKFSCMAAYACFESQIDMAHSPVKFLDHQNHARPYCMPASIMPILCVPCLGVLILHPGLEFAVIPAWIPFNSCPSSTTCPRHFGFPCLCPTNTCLQQKVYTTSGNSWPPSLFVQHCPCLA